MFTATTQTIFAVGGALILFVAAVVYVVLEQKAEAKAFRDGRPLRSGIAEFRHSLRMQSKVVVGYLLLIVLTGAAVHYMNTVTAKVNDNAVVLRRVATEADATVSRARETVEGFDATLGRLEKRLSQIETSQSEYQSFVSRFDAMQKAGAELMTRASRSSEIASICSNCSELDALTYAMAWAIGHRGASVRYLIPSPTPQLELELKAELLPLVQSSAQGTGTVECRYYPLESAVSAERTLILLNRGDESDSSFVSIPMSDSSTTDYAAIVAFGAANAEPAMERFNRRWAKADPSCSTDLLSPPVR